MKKKILLFLLSTIFVLTGMFFVGCGNSADNTTTYKELQKVVLSITENGSPFEVGSAGGINTNFYIKNFKNKNESNVLVDDDENYQILNAVSLNYIYKYYGELSQLPDKYNFSLLYTNATELKTKYNEMRDLSNELNGLSANANSSVYKACFSGYKKGIRVFVQQAFLTATSLGELLINNVKIASSLGTENQTQADLVKYLDYQYLMLFKDFSDFFMSSCEGQIIDDTLYNAVKDSMTLYCTNVIKKTNKEVSSDMAKELIRMSNALSAERRLYQFAINEFSLYDFTTKYQRSIEAYEKDLSDADSYIEELGRYLQNSDSAHKIYYNYLINNIKN